MSKLTELAAQIRVMLADHSHCLSEKEWERALLYAEARKEFTSDKLYGQWLKNLSESCSTVIDSTEKMRKLAAYALFYTKEEYLSLGFSKAKELYSKKGWKKYKESFDNLIKDAPTLSSREIREHKISILQGNPYPMPDDYVPNFTMPIGDQHVSQAKILRDSLLYTAMVGGYDAFCEAIVSSKPNQVSLEDWIKSVSPYPMRDKDVVRAVEHLNKPSEETPPEEPEPIVEEKISIWDKLESFSI